MSGRFAIACLAAPCLAALCPAPAWAADARLLIVDPAGHPLQGAVVSVYPAGGVRMPPAGGSYRVEQKDIRFRPGLLIVPVGARVAFPNLDRVRHHVYSFSAAKRFELKLYGRDETHSVLFDRPGTVALGCNIHDAMSGFIRVVDTPFALATGADGGAVLTGLPAGSVRVRIWHPMLRGRAGEMDVAAAIPAGGLRRTIAVPVRPA